jgi:nitroreductase
MNNFSDLIKNRRSMRKFTDEELSQDQVVSLLKAALMSPSSKRSNPWQFIVVDDKETLQKLSLCKEMGAAFLKDAALAIVVMADPLASDVWIEDAAIASLMIQLQAEDLGLGSCWIHRARQMFETPDGKDLMRQWGLPETMKGIGNCILGYADQLPVAKPRKEGRIIKVD